MPQHISVPSNLLDGVVRYVEVSSLTTKKALDEVGVHRQSQEKAAALRPALLDYMVNEGVVATKYKEAADAMLASHPESLQMLKAAVDKIAELKAEIVRLKGGTKQAGDLGAPETGSAVGGGYQHEGTYNSLTTPHVGNHTSELKESDRVLLKAAGINR